MLVSYEIESVRNACVNVFCKALRGVGFINAIIYFYLVFQKNVQFEFKRPL